MEESHPAIDLGWERGFSFTVSHVSKAAPQDDTNPLLARVRKALAYCRKATGLTRGSKSQSKYQQDIGLGSVNCSSSTSSHRQTHERRPTNADFGRDGSPAIYSKETESSYFGDNDPFITSPSWLREEEGHH